MSLHPAPQAPHAPIHMDLHLTRPGVLTHLRQTQDFTVLHAIPKPTEEDMRVLVSPSHLGGQHGYLREPQGQVQARGFWEQAPKNNLLLTPLTAVHIVTYTGEQRARGQEG